MNLREAAQQALDVMEDTRWVVADQAPNEDVAAHDKAITALRTALAEPTSQESRQVEPVAWAVVGDGKFGKYQLGNHFESEVQPNFKYWGNRGYELVPLYAAPPKREPLTKEQIEFRFCKKPTRYMLFLIRSTERAHDIGGEK